jgi:hypothetical protein
VYDRNDLPAMALPSVLLEVERLQQPDDLSCGPTSLLQTYRFLGIERTLDEVMAAIRRNPDGGTLAVYLGLSALEEGLAATIYSYNFSIFDPTWDRLSREEMLDRLDRRVRAVEGARLRRITRAYADFLREGGRLELPELDRRLLVDLLASGRPIITGLSATYLYRTPRELYEEYDDIRGYPVGHFVVISGYDPRTDLFMVVDPSPHTPYSATGVYPVPAERLMAAILLGDATYDAVLLVLDPPGDGAALP